MTNTFVDLIYNLKLDVDMFKNNVFTSGINTLLEIHPFLHDTPFIV